MILARQLSRVVARFGSNQNNAILLLNESEKDAYLRVLEENALLNYKTYPALPHQDPTSPEYIHSELDEYHDQTETQAYNKVIDNFKNDLKVQREVWEAIARLDRPYKRGIPGIDTNLDPNGPTTASLPDLGFPRRDINS
jgi:hypothetical protein